MKTAAEVARVLNSAIEDAVVKLNSETDGQGRRVTIVNEVMAAAFQIVGESLLGVAKHFRDLPPPLRIPRL